MTPGRRAYEGYLAKASGRSLISGDKLPGWDDLGDEVQAAWEAAGESVTHTVLTVIGGVGRASECELGAQGGKHAALRFVWHHILPQACGGKTEAGNLASLCDNCHYAVHAILWELSQGRPVPEGATLGQSDLAERGYTEAVAAGTQGKIPKEASG